MSSKSATSTPISTIHITTSQSTSVPWTTTNQATTPLTTYSAANTTHSSTLFTTSEPRTTVTVTNQGTTVPTTYSTTNMTNSSTLITTSVPRTTNQATTVPTTYSAANMTHSSTLFTTSEPFTINQAKTVPTTYSAANMTHSSTLFTTLEPITTNQATTVPTTYSATNMTHSSTLFTTSVPITTNQASTVPTTYSAANMTHFSTLFTTAVLETTTQALRTTTEAATTSTNLLNFESIYSTTATITPTNIMSTSVIKITGQPSTTCKKNSVPSIQSQTNAESTSNQSVPSLDTTVTRISSNRIWNNVTSILVYPTETTTATTDTITVPPIEHTDGLITSTMLSETGISNKTSFAETSVAYKYTDDVDIVTESSLVLTNKAAIPTQYYTQTDINSIHADTAPINAVRETDNTAGKGLPITGSVIKSITISPTINETQKVPTTVYEDVNRTSGISVVTATPRATQLDRETTNTAAMAEFSVLHDHFTAESLVTDILSDSRKMEKALLIPRNVSVRCCCQCCTNIPQSTCQFCSDFSTNNAATCASKIPQPYKSEYVRGMPNFQSPEPLIGSSFPARLVYNSDFETSEIFTEMFASMTDETRNSIGYSVNDLILGCEYNNAPCNIER